MTFVRFAREDESVSFGLLAGDEIQPLGGSPFGSWSEEGAPVALSAVRLLAPVEPSKGLALAGNFRDHLHGTPEPTQPEPFWKAPNAFIGPGETILLPAHVARVDAEGEAVAVIGSWCSRVSEQEALSHVLGYTCGNDVSGRPWQSGDTQWWRAKSADTFGPIGPAIVTDLDPGELSVITRINGAEVQRCGLADMIYDFATTISFISQVVTLQPGDVVFSGTSGTPAQLNDGDTCEVEIPGVGVLSNPVKLRS